MIPTGNPRKDRRMIRRSEKNMMTGLERLPTPLHGFAVKILAGPFVKASAKPKQTVYTRTIRALWRSL